MKQMHPGLWTTILLGLILTVPRIVAERPGATQQTYDVTRETTLTAKVSSVLARPEPGMEPGSHLILSVGSAKLDASLGRFALLGRNALAIEAGSEVEVTGLVQTVHEKQVMLVRMVKVDGRTYLIRNEHGVPISPQSRLREEKGEAR